MTGETENGRSISVSSRLLPRKSNFAIAHAAVTGGPCPSDPELARIYGTHSVGRARRLLAYFEERDLIVVRIDFHGRRVVAFPELGLETAPGDPGGEVSATKRVSQG